MPPDRQKLRRDGSPWGSPAPARGASRPAFEKGNSYAEVRHGAYSPRILSAEAARIRELLVERYPYLSDDIFLDSVELYCAAKARHSLLHEWCVNRAEEAGGDPTVVAPSVWDQAQKAEQSARALLGDIGLTARSHAAISRDLGISRQAAKALNENATGPRLGDRGRELRQARGALPS